MFSLKLSIFAYNSTDNSPMLGADGNPIQADLFIAQQNEIASISTFFGLDSAIQLYYNAFLRMAEPDFRAMMADYIGDPPGRIAPVDFEAMIERFRREHAYDPREMLREMLRDRGIEVVEVGTGESAANPGDDGSLARIRRLVLAERLFRSANNRANLSRDYLRIEIRGKENPMSPFLFFLFIFFGYVFLKGIRKRRR